MRCLFDGLSNNQLRQNRSTDERWRAAIGEKARGFNATCAYSEREAHAIAADGISLFAAGISVRDVARVARICDVIFEG